MSKETEEDQTKVLFDVGAPVKVVPPPEFFPEEIREPEPDRTEHMVFSPPLAGATISLCGKYRYVLWRKLKSSGKRILWICLNPSVADATIDDPSLNRMISFSKRMDAAEVFVCNLFAYRTPFPKDLHKAAKRSFDVVGPCNYDHILEQVWKCTTCVAGWGAGGSFQEQGRNVFNKIRKWHKPVMCLGKTKHGHPRHPLYVSGNAPLIPFEYPNDEGVEF